MLRCAAHGRRRRAQIKELLYATRQMLDWRQAQIKELQEETRKLREEIEQKDSDL